MIISPTLAMFSQWLVILFAIWLICVSLVMAVRPRLALRGLAKMASTNLINYTEITLRLFAGGALALYAEFSKFPEIFKVAGLFIVVTSLVLYIVPRTWHAAYSVWWSRKLSPLAVRLSSPFSLIVGALLIYAVL